MKVHDQKELSDEKTRTAFTEKEGKWGERRPEEIGEQEHDKEYMYIQRQERVDVRRSRKKQRRCCR